MQRSSYTWQCGRAILHHLSPPAECRIPSGVHAAESPETRLWMSHLSLPLYLLSFLLLAYGFEVLNVDAYLKDCFSAHQDEVNTLFNFKFRTNPGFAVVYFEATWLESRDARPDASVWMRGGDLYMWAGCLCSWFCYCSGKAE
ncbi:hypothetical protein C8F01DRAFT_367619 [Mycena amicta]|nr:hypothetical protein C8F01DRAFT_367619 [Mycena amicta]